VDDSASPFRLGADEQTLIDANGGVWSAEEEALRGPNGARAPRAPGTLAYWFAWQAFHPETEIEALPSVE